MTIVIGAIDDDGNLVFGSDSAASANDDLTVRSDSKVFAKDGYTIGFAGSYRFFQIVQYEMKLPTLSPIFLSDPLEFMVRKFVPALRACLMKHGHMTIESSVDGSDISSLLVGFHSYLFTVENDFHVAPHKEYAAIGSGAQVALGSLYSSKTLGTSTAYDAVETALYAAEYLCASVRGPMLISSD